MYWSCENNKHFCQRKRWRNAYASPIGLIAILFFVSHLNNEQQMCHEVVSLISWILAFDEPFQWKPIKVIVEISF
jgi:hypothetical protein